MKECCEKNRPVVEYFSSEDFESPSLTDDRLLFKKKVFDDQGRVCRMFGYNLAGIDPNTLEVIREDCGDDVVIKISGEAANFDEFNIGGKDVEATVNALNQYFTDLSSEIHIKSENPFKLEFGVMNVNGILVIHLASIDVKREVKKRTLYTSKQPETKTNTCQDTWTKTFDQFFNNELDSKQNQFDRLEKIMGRRFRDKKYTL